MKTHNPLKNNWDNWDWDSRQLSIFAKRLIISHLSRNKKVNMKNDISKKTATKVLKLGNMNENSAIFTLTGIKIHARTYRSDEFPCSRSARKWSQIHVSWPHLEGIMRHEGQSPIELLPIWDVVTMHCDSKRRQKSLELYGWNGLKSQKFIAQGNGYKQHALKGQKLLAQGSALGIMAIRKAPCKGKSFINFRASFKAFALTIIFALGKIKR